MGLHWYKVLVHSNIIMKSFLLCLAIFLTLPISYGSAQEVSSQNNENLTLPAEIDVSKLKKSAIAHVDQIIDGLTLTTRQGHVIRLSEIDIPDMFYPDGGDFGLQAKTALSEALPPGTKIEIYQTRQQDKGRTNRMGHDLAHVFTVDGHRWVNGMLVEKGLARVMPTQTNDEMNAALMTLEKTPRESKTGVWAAGKWDVLSPDTAQDGIGEYRVVEGVVYKVANIRNKTYLNFGADWKTDFTVMLDAKTRTALSRSGIDIPALEGKRVQIRGYIRNYNGPYMELEHPARLHLEPILTKQ